jgi:hypothetical protein
VELLAEAWFLNKARRYASLPAEERARFVEQQAAMVEQLIAQGDLATAGGQASPSTRGPATTDAASGSDARAADPPAREGMLTRGLAALTTAFGVPAAASVPRGGSVPRTSSGQWMDKMNGWIDHAEADAATRTQWRGFASELRRTLTWRWVTRSLLPSGATSGAAGSHATVQ